MSTLGARFARIIADLGDDKSVEISGKSLRQLKRYAAGDEPPFGVLRNLVEASGATFDWLTFDKPTTRKDYELSADLRQAEIKRLQKELEKVSTVTDAERLKGMLLLNQKMLALYEEWLRLDTGLTTPEAQQPRPAQTVSSRLLVHLAGELVIQIYRDENVRLPTNALPAEIARFYDRLAREAEGLTAEDDVRRLAVDLGEQLRSEIKGAVGDPGNGKREAS